jgi:hypothetical protein
MRKIVRYCYFANSWTVWDRQRREVVGYYAPTPKGRREAMYWAAQGELF